MNGARKHKPEGAELAKVEDLAAPDGDLVPAVEKITEAIRDTIQEIRAEGHERSAREVELRGQIEALKQALARLARVFADICNQFSIVPDSMGLHFGEDMVVHSPRLASEVMWAQHRCREIGVEILTAPDIDGFDDGHDDYA